MTTIVDIDDKTSRKSRFFATLMPLNLKLVLSFHAQSLIAEMFKFVDDTTKKLKLKFKTGRIEYKGHQLIPTDIISDILPEDAELTFYSTDYGLQSSKPINQNEEKSPYSSILLSASYKHNKLLSESDAKTVTTDLLYNKRHREGVSIFPRFNNKIEKDAKSIQNQLNEQKKEEKNPKENKSSKESKEVKENRSLKDVVKKPSKVQQIVINEEESLQSDLNSNIISNQEQINSENEEENEVIEKDSEQESIDDIIQVKNKKNEAINNNIQKAQSERAVHGSSSVNKSNVNAKEQHHHHKSKKEHKHQH